MSTTANRTRRAVPTQMAAAVAAVALLAMPVPTGAHGQTRTALLTLTDGTSLSQLADSVGALGGRVLNTLEIADSLIVELPTGAGIPAGAVEIPDTPMKVNGTQTYYETTEPTYVETIEGPTSEDDSVGAGVTVALIDTGVSKDADGLDHVEHINVTNSRDGDGFGHGTFLAGIIGGRGTFRGVAPGVDLIDVQVADKKGRTSMREVLAGIDAIADRGGVDVVNISLSAESPLPPSFDPLTRALDRLWEAGVTVVTAAGNDGPELGTVGSPGNDPLLLTVGALSEANTPDQSDDSLAEFSSRGSEYAEDKPELLAPGVSLVSTASPGSDAVSNTVWTSEDGLYMRGSGTSMAAAVVSGAAAVLLSERPELEPNGVKALFVDTAYSVEDSLGGGLDLGEALDSVDDAAIDPQQEMPGTLDDWGPNEDDAQVWADFAAAWEDGDFEAVQAAWEELSWQTQQWASRLFSLSVVAESVGQSKSEFAARSWAARSWAFDGWMARSWAARSWAARSWAIDEWVARSWAGRSWAARSWAARSWAVDEWLARSWAARSWAARSWAARSWAARSWAARSWAAGEDWSARSWAGRSWAARSWAARSWASDEQWAARSWAARSWATDTWTAGSWSMTY